MSYKAKSLQTLPPDGTILEDLIENMQSEYGTPATPQEYRLLIKVPSSDEASTKPAETIRLDPVDTEAADGEPRPARRRRGRRRRRRGSPPSAETVALTDEVATQIPGEDLDPEEDGEGDNRPNLGIEGPPED